ncbi:TetR/AcrR family transcriptional regulator [Nitrospina gracilis]|uniref:TetR/AcrR family transcriptional regulator n=1 Tax=Nitrospina gracilis TaxID=35801 RepID=UPI001F483281|nr:TetR/AcrR family transcriptional regulator [Nitrospina gracilis]MCF8721786.1 AcrR family transcriptional regulator [Nitrospina gracilis Nb-211]
MAQASKREQLVQEAVAMFSRDGFHAVGIDAISRQARTTKKTLYHHFKSKEELILAALRHYDERFRNTFMRAVESRAQQPAARLLAVFDVMKDWFGQKNFHGCILVAALGEFPDPKSPIRRACVESKKALRKYIRGLAAEAQLQKPDQLAEQITLLVEGAITLAQVNATPHCADQAKAAAAILIRNAQA